MDKNLETLKKMQQEKAKEKLEKLQEKVNITKYNMEVAEEIIAQTPSDTQQKKLTEKNIKRQHGLASLERQIDEIKESLEQ